MINMINTSIKHNGPTFNNCSSTRNVKYLVLKYSVLLVLFYNSCLDVYLFGIQFSLIQIQYVFFLLTGNVTYIYNITLNSMSIYNSVK